MKWRKQRQGSWTLRKMPYEGWVLCSKHTRRLICGIYKFNDPVYHSFDDKGLTIHTPKAARKWIGYKVKELLERRKQ